MKKISDRSEREQLKYYEEELDRWLKKENLLQKQQKALEREECFGAFWHANKAFSFPFKGEAFRALWDAILFLGATLILSGCSFFVVWAVLFCALVDLIYAILFGLCYPFIVAYFAIFKKTRIKILKAKINKTEASLSGMIKKSELEQKIRDLSRSLSKSESTYSSTSSGSGVEDTEWYKNKRDEYYRMYMGFPPKEEKTLSELSTDTTLDLHPGDY